MRTLIKPIKVKAHEVAQDKFKEQMEKICQLLDWTEDKYWQYQYTCYYLFINQLFDGFPAEMRKEVEYSPIMAGYWKNEWYLRNENEFVPFAEDICDSAMYVDQNGKIVYYQPLESAQEQAEGEFIFINSPKRLQNDIAFMNGYNQALKLIRNPNK